MKKLNLKRSKTFKAIVKVQISIYSSYNCPQVLIYNEDRSHRFEGDADKEIIKEMNGDLKRYYYANIPMKSGMIELLEEAPEQDW